MSTFSLYISLSERRIKLRLHVECALVPPQRLVPVVGSAHAFDGGVVVYAVVLSFQFRIAQTSRHREVGVVIYEAVAGEGAEALSVEHCRIVRAAHVCPSLRRVHEMEYPCLCVDGLLRIVAQWVACEEGVDLVRRDLV